MGAPRANRAGRQAAPESKNSVSSASPLSASDGAKQRFRNRCFPDGQNI